LQVQVDGEGAEGGERVRGRRPSAHVGRCVWRELIVPDHDDVEKHVCVEVRCSYFCRRCSAELIPVVASRRRRTSFFDVGRCGFPGIDGGVQVGVDETEELENEQPLLPLALCVVFGTDSKVNEGATKLRVGTDQTR
jgi:hypothetical protein